MRFEPGLIILAHMLDVVRDVPFLQIHPTFENDGAIAWMRAGAVPNFLGQSDEQLIGHFSQAADNFQGFASALVKVAKRTSPARSVEFCGVASSGLGDVSAATHIGAGLAIGEMQDDFVDAPAL